MVPPSAQLGHAALTKRYPQALPLLGELKAATTEVLDAATPLRRGCIELPESLEFEMIRLCVVAAQLDQLYRAYPFVIDKTTLLEGTSVVSFDKARAQVPWFLIDQVHDQVRRANIALGPLHANSAKAIAGMSFTGSELVGGADADLLVDGLLLDFKSTHKATSIGRSDVYQLAGYVLLDFDDLHQIDRVGVYWTRHGVLRTFTLSTFFQLLGATVSVPELRAELRWHLTAHERRRSSYIGTEQRRREHAATNEHCQPAEPGEEPQRSRTGLRRAAKWLRSALRN
ncbi:hypothetical protein E4P29_22385 [Rhodococcus sp. 1R11]|uniref:hypothetical protein n=1 Tax=Rhodococcus sp. 1R11 TaxID=2559614 RepID=UPI0010725304|nr:hypothetical protein [Rhodococcus sp. 1R11]TFI40941.1 hypothetical protein E4P29_22385 [Rhodococcus sp. 1R11]